MDVLCFQPWWLNRADVICLVLAPILVSPSLKQSRLEPLLTAFNSILGAGGGLSVRKEA